MILDEMRHIKVWLATLLYPAQTKPYMAEKKAHIQTVVQSELQHYTKTLAFIWPTAHHSPKHHSGSQEVSVFLQHTGCDIDNTSISSCIPTELSKGGQSCFRFSKQVSRLHTGLFAHALMQHTEWEQSGANQMC